MFTTRNIILFVVACVIAPAVRAIVFSVVGAIYYLICRPKQLAKAWQEAGDAAVVKLHGSNVKVVHPEPIDCHPCKQHQNYRANCPFCYMLNHPDANIDKNYCPGCGAFLPGKDHKPLCPWKE